LRLHFLCTANNLDTNPTPSLDRREFLEVFGYVFYSRRGRDCTALSGVSAEASELKRADVELVEEQWRERRDERE
jgi:ATP-dependent Lon protease